MTGPDSGGEPAPSPLAAAEAPKSPSPPGFFDHARSPTVVSTALRVAVVVGTVLTLINQGDALFGGGQVNVLKAVLTYAVPYMVSTHGAVTARLRLMSGPVAAGPGIA